MLLWKKICKRGGWLWFDYDDDDDDTAAARAQTEKLRRVHTNRFLVNGKVYVDDDEYDEMRLLRRVAVTSQVQVKKRYFGCSFFLSLLLQ